MTVLTKEIFDWQCALLTRNKYRLLKAALFLHYATDE